MFSLSPMYKGGQRGWWQKYREIGKWILNWVFQEKHLLIPDNRKHDSNGNLVFPVMNKARNGASWISRPDLYSLGQFNFMHTLLNINGYFVVCFWRLSMVCGILVPWQRIEPKPWQWKLCVLTTGHPGNSPHSLLCGRFSPHSFMIKVRKIEECFFFLSNPNKNSHFICLWLSA